MKVLLLSMLISLVGAFRTGIWAKECLHLLRAVCRSRHRWVTPTNKLSSAGAGHQPHAAPACSSNSRTRLFSSAHEREEMTFPFHPTVSTKPSIGMLPHVHDPVSREFLFYRQRRFGEGTSFDDMRRSMPKLFDLSMLDSIFTSWNSSWQSVTNKREYSLDNQNAFISAFLEVDHHMYLSEVKVTHFYRDKKRECILMTKLPNNSYSHRGLHELKVLESADFRYRSGGYRCVKLDAAHLAQLPRMTEFAKAYLSSSSVSCKMFYNLNDAIDFKVYNMRGGEDSVCFSFHHLDNLDHEFDEITGWMLNSRNSTNDIDVEIVFAHGDMGFISLL